MSAKNKKIEKPATLKRIDRFAVCFLLIGPVFFRIAMGAGKVGMIVPLVFFSSVIYIVTFNILVHKKIEASSRWIARFAYEYPGHHLAWFLMILMGMVIKAVIMG